MEGAFSKNQKKEKQTHQNCHENQEVSILTKTEVPEHCKHRYTLQYTINAFDHVLLMIQNLC